MAVSWNGFPPNQSFMTGSQAQPPLGTNTQTGEPLVPPQYDYQNWLDTGEHGWRPQPPFGTDPAASDLTFDQYMTNLMSSGQGAGGKGGTQDGSVPDALWQIPQAPYAPTPISMQGVMSGVPSSPLQTYQTALGQSYQGGVPGIGGVPGYDTSSYNIPTLDVAAPWNVPQMDMPSQFGIPEVGIADFQPPDVSRLLPNADWYSGFSPEILTGLNAPYDDARSQMLEQMGARGQLGAPDAMSGAAGAALGEFEANRARDVGLQAWQMTQPGLQQDYAAQLQRAQFGGQQQATANQWEAQAQLATQGKWQDMEMSKAQWEAGEQAAANRWQTMNEQQKNQYLANVGLDRERYDSMGENERSRYLAAAELSEQTRMANQQTQSNQMYSNAMNQMQSQWMAAENANRQQQAMQQNMLNQQLRGEFQQENMQDYQAMMNQQQQDYGMDKNIWQSQLEESRFPWTALPGMLGGTYASPVVNPGQDNGAGQAMQALMMLAMMAV